MCVAEASNLTEASNQSLEAAHKKTISHANSRACLYAPTKNTNKNVKFRGVKKW